MAERLKLTACPHCQSVGTLIRHGCLRGYDESSPRQKTVRARRVFCSNRNARPGCGRTFSVFNARKIRRLSLTAGCLWRFLQNAVAGSLAAASHAASSLRCDRTWQRVWKRFDLGQSKIRTALSGLCRPPQPPAGSPTRPPRRPAAAETLAHLQAAFPQAECPVAAFQRKLHTFFV